jgi:hypothetical protein
MPDKRIDPDVSTAHENHRRLFSVDHGIGATPEAADAASSPLRPQAAPGIPEDTCALLPGCARCAYPGCELLDGRRCALAYGRSKAAFARSIAMVVASMKAGSGGWKSISAI